jgi:hypothetical protein
MQTDVVTLAVMEPSSPRLAGKLEQLERAIDDSSIEVQLITLENSPGWNDADDAFLP